MSAKIFPVQANKGERARQRLLIAALEKISEKGYDTASVREIADAAGQNVAAIAYYFGSKKKLYAALLEGVGSHIRGIFSDLDETVRQRLEAGTLEPAEAIRLLKAMLRAMVGVQMGGGGDFEKLHRIMVHEQTTPSDCFPILYDKTLRPLHERFTSLLAIARGEDPTSPEVILRAHALFGQAISFTWVRPTIVRRLGVRQLDATHAATISALIEDHIDLICNRPSTP
ncbi:AcrR family transcriptional regulator [Haloferula luteola]|uniref:AcrR family transcriptional regulator n=1 Tax=Haloferula luteola TaxID=595692 RepID=A0A840V5T7_9BACT|nr:AcrR family transcriptional regulator [Haloferula luteola]